MDPNELKEGKGLPLVSSALKGALDATRVLKRTRVNSRLSPKALEGIQNPERDHEIWCIFFMPKVRLFLGISLSK